MPEVQCPDRECEANKKGYCSLPYVSFYRDSVGLHCSQKFEPYERVQGYIPSWEVPPRKEVKKNE